MVCGLVMLASTCVAENIRRTRTGLLLLSSRDQQARSGPCAAHVRAAVEQCHRRCVNSVCCWRMPLCARWHSHGVRSTSPAAVNYAARAAVCVTQPSHAPTLHLTPCAVVLDAMSSWYLWLHGGGAQGISRIASVDDCKRLCPGVKLVHVETIGKEGVTDQPSGRAKVRPSAPNVCRCHCIPT